MHQLAIHDNLMLTNTVGYTIGRIRTCGDLNFSPLLVCRHELAGSRTLFELGVDALVFDAALALDEW